MPWQNSKDLDNEVEVWTNTSTGSLRLVEVFWKTVVIFFSNEKQVRNFLTQCSDSPKFLAFADENRLFPAGLRIPRDSSYSGEVFKKLVDFDSSFQEILDGVYLQLNMSSTDESEEKAIADCPAPTYR